MTKQNTIIYTNTDEISLTELVAGIDQAIKDDSANLVVFNNVSEFALLTIHSIKKLPPLKKEATA